MVTRVLSSTLSLQHQEMQLVVQRFVHSALNQYWMHSKVVLKHSVTVNQTGCQYRMTKYQIPVRVNVLMTVVHYQVVQLILLKLTH